MTPEERKLLAEIEAGLRRCEQMLEQVRTALEQRERDYQAELRHCREGLNLKTDWAAEIKATAIAMNRVQAAQLPPRS